ncbi:hypothetical protein F443_06908 [Phytophthora nicotianae P1569]|uniref:Uncharacterized protein n=1 Tax=Phytophthora nicotianae P1569 TaxID=1317065 RepID=V9FFH7_PHYNI|nr:hypothetical protein F443_06908 [Phytophthora nicotianae P1569]
MSSKHLPVGKFGNYRRKKRRPTLQELSEAIPATFPFQDVAMDHILYLPKSHKGNTGR